MSRKQIKLNDVWNNTVSMLHDRGYILKKKHCQNDWNPIICNKQGKAIVKKKISENDSNKYQKVYIFMADKKLGIKDLRTTLLDVNKNSTNQIILILQQNLTSQAKDLLSHSKYYYEIFTFEEMSLNPTKHILVPKHELLTDKEAEEFKKNIKEKIPSIKLNDRIARHFGAKIGDIFRIYRKKEKYFRMVVE